MHQQPTIEYRQAMVDTCDGEIKRIKAVREELFQAYFWGLRKLRMEISAQKICGEYATAAEIEAFDSKMRDAAGDFMVWVDEALGDMFLDKITAQENVRDENDGEDL